MDITYLGHSSFKLRGKGASVVIDPFDSGMVGLPFPKVSADIVLVSHDHKDHNALDRVTGTQTRPEPFTIVSPGEYEVQGVSVFGITSYHDNKEGETRGKNTIFVIHIDDLVIAHLGDLGHKLSQKQIEDIGNVDVVLVPVGGKVTLNSAEAAEVVEQLEPVIVVPMHYKQAGMKETFNDLAGVDSFLKEMGAENARREKKLTLVKSALPEDREIVVMEGV